MRRLNLLLAMAVVLACGGVAARAQTTIETDGDVQAQGFDGDGSKLTNVDAATLDGEVKGSFATAAELLAAIEALDNPDGPCFDATRRFADCGNGTVTDTATGLIYLQNANCFGLQDWVTASQSAAGLADGACGLTGGSRPGGWRLPTREEWEGIVDSSCTTDPEIVGNQMTRGIYTDAGDAASEWASGVVSSVYWSSATYSLDSTTAFSANFENGFVKLAAFKVDSHYVWPVRGGQ